MKIIEAIRFKNSTAVIALTEDKMISVDMYRHYFNISVRHSCSFSAYKEDTENYEPISIYSFNRVLRVTKHRIDSALK